MGITIAIDGPSGSGKSTVSREVARRNKLAYLDTGAMYRAATWWVQEQGVDLQDEVAVVETVKLLPLIVPIDPDDQTHICNGEDISAIIRSPELSAVVSIVSSYFPVRDILIEMQRNIIQSELTLDSFSSGRGIVTEGRDITTVVNPDADVRVLLIASEEARLRRRATELSGKADEETLNKTRDIVSGRDRIDSAVTKFMTASDGVVTIDSSDMTIEEVVAAVEERMERVQ
ncbi:(d)CMP kinase [Flaviflexus massiliensis]|uniref:(d)CMP kinase n=1 Tax=Flaviflexus massiliensis TaxID=1522309 RepID=UPI0006D5A770|nr:(d)CMP kinase [Flaviflexus massiliensis]